MRTSVDKEDKQAIWRERISEARGLGGSRRKYCLERGISYSQFQYWRKTLEESAEAKSLKEATMMPSPFARISLQAEPALLPPTSVSGARFIAEVLWHLSGMVRS